MFFVDDIISGTAFDRPDFQRMQRMIETEEIGTVIVKDLSRFERQHILFDHYTHVLYPSFGVNFIFIQENVETICGKGTEMMPFHNLFNEWYTSQTRKCVRFGNPGRIIEKEFRQQLLLVIKMIKKS